MFRRTLSSSAVLALLLALSSFAHAGLSEIRADFPSQTAALSATAIFSAPSSSANYLVCASLQQSPANAMTATVAWTDENGNAQSFSLVDSQAGCSLIRNEASTAATIAVSGTPYPIYSVYVFGFGFWPGQPQKQAGITETFNSTITAGNSSGYIAAGDTLVAVTSASGSGCTWSVGSYPSNITGIGVGIVATNESSSANVFSNTSSGCSETVVALNFGTPGTGSGPLTDYEYNLIGWTDATDPNYKTVFTAGSSGASILMGANIAEQPNGGSVSEELNTPLGDVTAGPGGAPASETVPGSVAANAVFQILTLNTPGSPWGTAPAYSAETDVIQF